MQKDPITNKWTYNYTFKVSAAKRREIESCAKRNNITVNRLIKDSIDMYIKTLDGKCPNGNGILRNQLELF